MSISVFDFVSLFCPFSEWSSKFIFYVDSDDSDDSDDFDDSDSSNFVRSITVDAAKRYFVVSAFIDNGFIRCFISEKV